VSLICGAKAFSFDQPVAGGSGRSTVAVPSLSPETIFRIFGTKTELYRKTVTEKDKNCDLKFTQFCWYRNHNSINHADRDARLADKMDAMLGVR